MSSLPINVKTLHEIRAGRAGTVWRHAEDLDSWRPYILPSAFFTLAPEGGYSGRIYHLKVTWNSWGTTR
jgi:hypothetical protein